MSIERHTSPTLDPEVIAEMRAWIADNIWTNLSIEDIDDLHESLIVRGIRRHYDGGIPQFLTDMEQ